MPYLAISKEIYILNLFDEIMRHNCIAYNWDALKIKTNRNRISKCIASQTKFIVQMPEHMMLAFAYPLSI